MRVCLAIVNAGESGRIYPPIGTSALQIKAVACTRQFRRNIALMAGNSTCYKDRVYILFYRY